MPLQKEETAESMHKRAIRRGATLRAFGRVVGLKEDGAAVGLESEECARGGFYWISGAHRVRWCF